MTPKHIICCLALTSDAFLEPYCLSCLQADSETNTYTDADGQIPRFDTVEEAESYCQKNNIRLQKDENYEEYKTIDQTRSDAKRTSRNGT